MTWTPTPGDDQRFLDLAIEQASTSWDEGGVPIGAVLVHEGRVLAAGHNQRVQQESAILHAETDTIERAGRLPASVYRGSVLYTTLSPCLMCAGTALLYRIPASSSARTAASRGPRPCCAGAASPWTSWTMHAAWR